MPECQALEHVLALMLTAMMAERTLSVQGWWQFCCARLLNELSEPPGDREGQARCPFGAGVDAAAELARQSTPAMCFGPAAELVQEQATRA